MKTENSQLKLFYSDLYLVIAVLTSIVIVLTELPTWVTLFVSLALFARYLVEINIIKMPKAIVLNTLGLLAFTFVFASYKTIWGLVESSILLVILSCLFILSYKSQREHQLLILIGFILVVLKSLFSADLIWVVLSALSFICLWLSLLTNSITNKYKFFLPIILKALPLFAILFIFFPRFVMYQSERISAAKFRVGFSENMNPGRISEIAEDNSVAFYAYFQSQDQKLTNSDLYWRGEVLTQENGFEWKKEKSVPQKIQPKVDPGRQESKTSSQYQIYLSANSKKYIFYLDFPSTVLKSSEPVELFDNGVYKFIFTQAEPSEVLFSTDYDQKFKLDEINEDKIIPPTLSEQPLTNHWINEVQQKAKTDQQKLSAIKTLFLEQKLKYTLRPGQYATQAIDDFLFQRKLGFCEHFAGTYALLARHLGLQARVVVGYQGGKYNPVGNFWTIYQKDAHAWVEVLQNGFWQRIDPTEWIAPLRLQLPAAEYFELSDQDKELSFLDLQNKNNHWYYRLGDQAQFLFEHLNYKWSTLIIDYDRQTQSELIKKYLNLNVFLTISFLLLTAILVAFLIKHFKLAQKNKQHPYDKLFNKLQNGPYLKNESGLSCLTPNEVIQKLNQIKPNPILLDFYKDYESIRYKMHQSLYSSAEWNKKLDEYF